jgi:hypothetical protein
MVGRVLRGVEQGRFQGLALHGGERGVCIDGLERREGGLDRARLQENLILVWVSNNPQHAKMTPLPPLPAHIHKLQFIHPIRISVSNPLACLTFKAFSMPKTWQNDVQFRAIFSHWVSYRVTVPMRGCHGDRRLGRRSCRMTSS